MRRALLAAAVALGLVAAVSTAAADIPASDGTIHGCYDTQHPFEGALVVIDSEDTCPTGTESLDWNQAGAPGLADVERVELPVSQGMSGSLNKTATCPVGKTVISGGYSFIYSTTVMIPTLSAPTGDLSGWTVTFSNNGNAATVNGSVYAVCAVVDP